MKFLQKIISILIWPYRKISLEYRYRKKLKELRKQDPFIYH